MMVKKIVSVSSLFEYYCEPREEWDYLEEPTYSRSIGSHVCMTCSKLDYSIQADFGSILRCKRHQKLIFHSQHLTHSCERYQKKVPLYQQKT